MFARRLSRASKANTLSSRDLNLTQQVILVCFSVSEFINLHLVVINCLNKTTIESVVQKRFSLSYEKAKFWAKSSWKPLLGLREWKKGKSTFLRRKNEGRYMLVVHDKELEDRNDSDISTNTLRIT